MGPCSSKQASKDCYGKPYQGYAGSWSGLSPVLRGRVEPSPCNLSPHEDRGCGPCGSCGGKTQYRLVMLSNAPRIIVLQPVIALFRHLCGHKGQRNSCRANEPRTCRSANCSSASISATTVSITRAALLRSSGAAGRWRRADHSDAATLHCGASCYI